jgi:hypothetical protein
MPILYIDKANLVPRACESGQANIMYTNLRPPQAFILLHISFEVLTKTKEFFIRTKLTNDKNTAGYKLAL